MGSCSANRREFEDQSGIMGSCSANRREFEDQSAIKGNLNQKNAFLWPNKAL